ncbi:MAG: branched-chain amino acid ABC transporter permease [Leadbetterella sp.]|nr:branched-chain amino acid ABC transporter permease [Leadbetterella sp.]
MDYILHLLILSLIYSILAIGLNLVVGYAGLLSIAHAAFFGIGAYATAILTAQYGMGFIASILVGIFIAIILSILSGLVLSNFKDDYYALGSISFNIIVFNILLNAHQLTNGALGIPAIPRPVIFNFSFSSNLSFFLLTVAIFFAVFFISRHITKSPFCKILMAIREDEEAIQAFGYDTTKYKLLIFIIASAFASMAGALFASYETFIDPGIALPMESIFILTIIIFGGLANISGSILGAFLLILIPEFLRFVGFPLAIEAQMRQFIFGALLIILMFYRPQGILGKYKL